MGRVEEFVTFLKKKRIDITKNGSKKYKLIKSLPGKDRIIELHKLSNDFGRMSAIEDLPDELKIQALGEFSDKKMVIDQLPFELKIKALGQIENNDLKISIVNELPDELKIQALDKFDSDSEKVKVVDLLPEELQISLLNKFENDESKSKILDKISRNTKISFLDKIQDEKTKDIFMSSIKKDIVSEIEKNESQNKSNADICASISALPNSQLRILYLKNLKNDSERATVINEFNNAELKIEALDSLTDKAQINKVLHTLSIEEKVQQMHRLNEETQENIFKESGLTDKQKFDLLKQSKSDIVRTSIIKSFSSDENKLKVLPLVKDENLKLNIINQSGLDEETKFVEFNKVSPEKTEMLTEMKKNNIDVLKTIDMRMLDLPLNLDAINQMSCYEDVQEKILQLNGNGQKVFCKLVEYLQSNENKKDNWTYIISDILENMSKGEYDELIEDISSEEKIEDIAQLTEILGEKNEFGLKNRNDIINISQIRKEYLDKIFQSDNLADKQSALIRKVLGINGEAYNLATNVENIKAIESFEKNSEIRNLLDSIVKIKETKDVDTLNKIYNGVEEAPIISYQTLKKWEREQFGKEFNKGLFNIESAEKITEDINGKVYDNVYEAGTDFKMIVTVAGGIIKNEDKEATGEFNYNKDWNKKLIAGQHMCCSYIRNDFNATVSLKHHETGKATVCYGFYNMEPDAFLKASPGDAVTKNLSMNFESRGINCLPDQLINETDFIYNEVNYKRIQNGEKKQPDYLVIFKTNGKIDEDIMQEAQKASKDFGGLPIVVVDRDKCLEAERNRTEELINQYKEIKSPELAKEIYHKISNNRNNIKHTYNAEKNKTSFLPEINLEEYEQLAKEAETKNVNLSDLEENYDMTTLQDRNTVYHNISRQITQLEINVKTKVEMKE